MGKSTSANQLLNQIPDDRPVALMIRHGGKDEWDTALLESIGSDLNKKLKFVASSTYAHCVAQGESIVSATGQALSVTLNDDLGNPSILINKTSLEDAKTSWSSLGHDAISLMLTDGKQVPGFNDPDVSSLQLLGWMLEQSKNVGNGVSLFISHDIVILVILARMFKMHLNQDEWPERFEGCAFWRENDKVICRYRGITSEASLV